MKIYIYGTLVEHGTTLEGTKIDGRHGTVWASNEDEARGKVLALVQGDLVDEKSSIRWVSVKELPRDLLMADERCSVGRALDVIRRYGGIDEAHHKTWVIDQVTRALCGDGYEQFVKDCCAGEDGPDTYSWDTGIAP